MILFVIIKLPNILFFISKLVIISFPTFATILFLISAYEISIKKNLLKRL